MTLFIDSIHFLSFVLLHWMNLTRAICMEHVAQTFHAIDKRFVPELLAPSNHSYPHGNLIEGQFNSLLSICVICNAFSIENFINSMKIVLDFRIQSLQSLVSYAHWDVPIANIKGEMMFRSWKELFDTNGEFSYQSPRLYSFNGRDVLHDSTW